MTKFNVLQIHIAVNRIYCINSYMNFCQKMWQYKAGSPRWQRKSLQSRTNGCALVNWLTGWRDSENENDSEADRGQQLRCWKIMQIYLPQKLPTRKYINWLHPDIYTSILKTEETPYSTSLYPPASPHDTLRHIVIITIFRKSIFSSITE